MCGDTENWNADESKRKLYLYMENNNGKICICTFFLSLLGKYKIFQCGKM